MPARKSDSTTFHQRVCHGRVLALASALIVGAIAGPTGAADIVLHSTAAPQSRIVRLGDVATIQNANGVLAKRLSELPLMPAPVAGSTHKLTASDVRDFLAVLGEDLSSLTFSGAQHVTIGLDRETSNLDQEPPQSKVLSRTRRQELTAGLEKLLVTHVAQQSGDPGPWELALEDSEGLIQALDQAVTRPHIVGGAAPWEGEHEFLVEFLNEEGEVRLSAPAAVSRKRAVIVAKLPMEADRLITRALVDVKYVSANEGRTTRRPAAQSLEDVLGRVTTRSLRPGDTIYLDQLRAPLFVRRGETVQAVARGGGVEVRIYAKARNDGLPGDLIEIEPLHSKQRIYGRVVGQGQVEVYAGGAAVGGGTEQTAAAISTQARGL